MHPDFPQLDRGEVYLDSATTSLVPAPVVQIVAGALAKGGSPGRGGHARGQGADQAYAQARESMASLLGGSTPEIVFVPGTTFGLNLIAQGWGQRLCQGDEILVSVAEHNASFLPWHRVSQNTGARVIPVLVDERGDLDLDDLSAKLGPRTRVLAINHVSNVTGSVTDIAALVARVRASPAKDALVVVDGAQAAAHLELCPKTWGCDFYVFSGHKSYGVPGAGVVWGAAHRWAQCQPLWVGGGAVERASFDEVVLREGPAAFEPGTINLPAVQGMLAGMNYARAHLDPEKDTQLLDVLQARLAQIPGIRLLGAPRKRAGCISWVHDGVHAHDIATILDGRKLRLRAGHHCAHRLLAHFGVHHSLRASIAHFNTLDDIERLAQGLEKAQEIFA